MGTDSHCILVVEDDPLLARAIARELGPWAREVHVAHDVQNALRLLALQPDLITLDIGLPDGTGLEIARAASKLRPIPDILAISGRATAQEAFRLAALGVRAFLAKPISLDSLCTTVQAILDNPRDLSPLLAGEVGRLRIRDVQTTVRRTMLEQALAIAGGNLTHAAKLLSVSRQAVQQMVRDLDIDVDSFRDGDPSDD